MNKIWIGAGAVVIVGLIALGFWLTAPSSRPAAIQNVQPSGQSPLPVAGSITTVAATSSASSVTMLLAAPGGTIQTNNFINDPATVQDPIAPGYFYLGYHPYDGSADPTAVKNPPYLIEYINATQYFNIALLEEPIGAVRGEMEQYLLTHLGITQDQACRLNYMVSVPNRVNSAFSGRNLGFSFCPGAAALPQ